ncbi:YbcC family protein [Halopseudomonas salegens]|uniref:Probable inorganic carbon transporter subunit DabA n=1 Tax=Halopseudomonas salegens TaxID=1434072 RepID=A0A1H2ENJ1_9GAMM|nr:DUF2309 domain-containing protein [Halopseudomonas salegens]SDT96752.1 hypothetical protein SAMN05216210_0904 [Halopseudomonas salegens]
MNMPENVVLDQQGELIAAAEAACTLIAPTWPLDRLIAVNPLWERRGEHWQAVTARLWQQSGSLLTLTAEGYASAWQQGRVTQSHLQAALDESGLDWRLDDVHHRLNEPIDAGHILPLLEEMTPVKGNVPAWSELITHQIGQFCAAWFDREQADWQLTHTKGMYATWRDSLQHDYGLTVLSGCNALQQRAARLPQHHIEVLAQAIEQLEVDQTLWADWFDTLLQRSLGWASWCAYQRWQAELQGQQDHSLTELLAIRAAWQLLLDDGARDHDSPWAHWRQAFKRRLKKPPQAHWQALQIWQRADELAWQQQLQARLCAADATAPSSDVFARLFFCIDVRSEVMRRAIEQVSPAIETSGFAGFFGLPIEYAPLGSDTARPQLPGLLAPQIRVSESSGDLQADQDLSRRRSQQQQRKGRWQLFERLPASTFTLVETLGLGYASKLAAHQLGPRGHSSSNAHEQVQLTPVLTGLDSEQKVDLIERILTAMGLRCDFPPLLVLIGHGSQSANNPQLAGLACGACCGQSGEVNARLLASLLNDTEIRHALLQRGIRIGKNCHAVAGLHNTTTDEIILFDAQQVPAALKSQWQALRQLLDQATHRARAERASALGLKGIKDQPAALLKALRKRACDWAQTRPEWGLANNAAFIAAPRSCTRGVDLQGRVFLHDYDWQTDHDGSVLELIMTAPVVVAHWINMQYLTSTTDNQRFGSGNKVLHNVVGRHIGLFEGNGGDLRIGLARQSLHDGERWMHTPLRLTVVVKAPREMIDTVLAKHRVVRQLVENQWLYLQCLDPDAPSCLMQRNEDGWHPV